MNNVTKVLENYSKTRSYYNGLNEATQYGDVAGLKQFFLPVMTVAMPNLIAEDKHHKYYSRQQDTIYPYKGYMEEAFPVQFYKLYY